MNVAAIIPAAGMGLRMGGKVPKQFLSLSGKLVMLFLVSKVHV